MAFDRPVQETRPRVLQRPLRDVMPWLQDWCYDSRSVDSVAAQEIRDNFNERLESIGDCLAAISGMRTMPDDSDVRIGGARRTRGVVLFADIVKSSRLAVKYADVPEAMLATLDLVVPTLMDVARYYRGEFEKNTGDGILAYFGVGSTTDEDAVSLALDAAVGMMDAVRDLVTPVLKTNGLEPVQITIGADLGEFLVARIGLARQQSPIVAVGAVANRAAKIQGSSSPGQVRVGEDLFKTLSKDSRKLFTSVDPPSPWEFQVRKTQQQIESDQYWGRPRCEAQTGGGAAALPQPA